MTTDKHLSWAGKTIVVLLTLWGLLVIAPDFLRVLNERYNNKLGFEADNNGVLIESSDSQSLAGCSRVDLRRNYREGRLNDLLAVFGGMGGMQYVRPDLQSVTLYFLCRAPGGEPESVLRTVRAEPTPLSFAAKLTLLIAECLGVFFIMLAARMVWHRPSPTTWGFFLYAVWFNPGQYFVWYSWLQQWPYALLAQEFAHAVFQALGYCGFVLFALRFPGDAVDPRWRHVERALPAVGSAILTLQLWSFLVVFGMPSEFATRLTFFAGLAVDLAVLVILFIRYREHALEERHRIRYVFWGCIVGLTAFVLAETQVATTVWDQRLPEAGIYLLYALNASVAIAVYHAIRKYRVVDIKFALSRSATRVLLWVLVGVFVVKANAHAEQYLHDLRHRFEESEALLSIAILIVLGGAAVGLKFIVDFVHEHAVEIFDHLFFRKLVHAQERLARVAEALAESEATPPEEVDDRIVAEPVAALELASAAVFRVQSDDSYRRASAEGWPPGSIEVLAKDLPWIRTLTIDKSAALELEREQLPPGMPEGPPFPSIAIPLVSGGRLYAVAFYGAHKGGDDLNRDEIKSLRKLGRAASLAYQNFELVSLRAKLQELEQRPKSAEGKGSPPAAHIISRS